MSIRISTYLNLIFVFSCSILYAANLEHKYKWSSWTSHAMPSASGFYPNYCTMVCLCFISDLDLLSSLIPLKSSQTQDSRSSSRSSSPGQTGFPLELLLLLAAERAKRDAQANAASSSTSSQQGPGTSKSPNNAQQGPSITPTAQVRYCSYCSTNIFSQLFPDSQQHRIPFPLDQRPPHAMRSWKAVYAGCASGHR